MTTIKVIFDRAEKGLGYELYRVKGSKRHLCRQENQSGNPVWCTFSDEPANEVRTDLAIEILNKEGNTVAIEQNKEVNGFIFADKKFPFNWEKENYESVLKSGMFFEFHPELSGNWAEDLGKWANISGKIINKPKPAEAKILYPLTCKHSDFFQKTFTNLANKREYWLFTEVFCYLHGGKDLCNCNT